MNINNSNEASPSVKPPAASVISSKHCDPSRMFGRPRSADGAELPEEEAAVMRVIF